MKDYRLPENRREYFTALYRMNLEHGVMPGLVYLYMPKLAEHFGWDDEQKLWFATINGCTQNPITSLKIFNQQPEIPKIRQEWSGLDQWFNLRWADLQFDTDRLKNKRNTIKGLFTYAELVEEHGSQATLWSNKSFKEYWNLADKIYGFGRLSKFSYLEYVRIMGFGADCDDLMFEDFDGSRSHRNGALFLNGLDDLVFDKRANNGFDGKYNNYKGMCVWLESMSETYLETCGIEHKDLGRFTLESQFCQFKNGFFRRRFPGIYSDLAWERIQWYDERGESELTQVFKDIREEHLPDWLRIESEAKPLPRAKRAAVYADTGVPYRAEHFLFE